MRPISLTVGEVPSGAVAYKSNQEILEAFAEYNASSLKDTTANDYWLVANRFIEAWDGMMVSALEPPHIMAYIGHYSELCVNLRRRPNSLARDSRGRLAKNTESSSGFQCSKGLDSSDCANCPSLEPIQMATVERTMNALTRLYDMLVDHRMLDHNPMLVVKRQWLKRNKHRRRRPQQRGLVKSEVEAMIGAARYMNGKFIIFALCKWGARVGEACKLRLTKDLYNEAEGYFKIPEPPGTEVDKRRGNRYLFIDPQMAAFLKAYLPWRARVMEANGHSHDYLFVSRHGEHYDSGTRQDNILVDIMRPIAVSLGIQAADASRRERVTAHSARHFFSTALVDNEKTGFWWFVLRGDLAHDNEQAYIHATLAKVRQHYMDARPVLDIDVPLDSFAVSVWAREYVASIQAAEAGGVDNEAKEFETMVRSQLRWLPEPTSLRAAAERAILAWTPTAADLWFGKADIPLAGHDSQAVARALTGLYQHGVLLRMGERRGCRYKVYVPALEGYLGKLAQAA